MSLIGPAFGKILRKKKRAAHPGRRYYHRNKQIQVFDLGASDRARRSHAGMGKALVLRGSLEDTLQEQPLQGGCEGEVPNS